jgi:hypothetical protein
LTSRCLRAITVTSMAHPARISMLTTHAGPKVGCRDRVVVREAS